MKSHRHAMVEMRPRDRSTLNLLGIEDRKMASVPVLIEDIRQQIPFAFSPEPSRFGTNTGSAIAKRGPAV